MAAYRLATGGVVRTADAAFIPNDTGNRDWNIYQEWLAVPNTPDPVTTPTLAAYKLSKKASVDLEAERRAQILAPHTLLSLLYFEEALSADADGSPTAGEYPLLDARADSEASTIAAVADAVLAESLALRTAIATIEVARLAGRIAIDAAASIAAVDVAVAAIAWP